MKKTSSGVSDDFDSVKLATFRRNNLFKSNLQHMAFLIGVGCMWQRRYCVAHTLSGSYILGGL